MAEKHVLALATMEKLIKRSGGKRVSEDAKDALRKKLEMISDQICERAVKKASYAGRKTIKGIDLTEEENKA